MAVHTFTDREDLRRAVAERILARPPRREALRRARADTIGWWLGISRRTLFATLKRLGLTLGELQRGRI